MKKLGKLEINSGRLIKDEDLQKFRGGWVGQCALYLDGGPSTGGDYVGLRDWYCYNMTQWECDNSCEAGYEQFYPGHTVYCICNYGY